MLFVDVTFEPGSDGVARSRKIFGKVQNIQSAAFKLPMCDPRVYVSGLGWRMARGRIDVGRPHVM